jgi:transposase-like protein
MEMNLVRLVKQFGSEEKCWRYLEELRWPNGVKCPRCSGAKISRIKKRRQFDCDSCRYQFSATAGTIFHDTHLPLWKWFAAMYLMIEAKKGISANQLKRTLAVSYKTAWYLCHRIRKAVTELERKELKGVIEVDETYVGGKRHGKGRIAGWENKTCVVGAIERGGKARLDMVPNRGGGTLRNFITRKTVDDLKVIITDDYAGYDKVEDVNTAHETVNHSREEWVRGEFHTNSIENVWSLLKRSIVGSYHKISTKHLERYLDELEWKFNNRNNPFLFRDTMKKLIESENLEYKKLISA